MSAGTAVAAPAQPTASAIIRLRHPAGLQAFARAVSDPRSPRYRDYLSIETLTRRFGAGSPERARASRWARVHRLDATVLPSGAYMLVTATDARLRAALDARGSSASAASVSLGVPRELRGVAEGVELLGRNPNASAAQRAPAALPAVDARATHKRIPEYDIPDPYHGLPPALGSAARRSGTPEGCPEGIATGGFTPSQVATAYGLDKLHERKLRGEGMRIALVEVDGFQRSDVATFAKCFGARMPAIHTTSLEGRPLPPGDETPLDLETMIAAAPRLGRIDVYEASPQPGNIAADLLKATAFAIEAHGQHPDAISLSLGYCEAAFGIAAAEGGSVIALRALNDAFALGAASGISIFASAGDTGSGGCERVASTALPLAEFPATSPWVTAVGGTNLQLDATNRIEREVVWNDTPANARVAAERHLEIAPNALAAAGGGGRSLYFSRPWWQRAPGLTDSPRRVPDVAALADPLPGYAYYCTSADCESTVHIHGWGTIGGTSAAAPLTAAGVTLMDQSARRHRQRPVGFVNPLVYEVANSSSHASILNDVTVGSNDVSAATPSSTVENVGKPIGVFPAAPGYDMASGWGSLRFLAFNTAALSAGGTAASAALAGARPRER